MKKQLRTKKRAGSGRTGFERRYWFEREPEPRKQSCALYSGIFRGFQGVSGGAL